MDLKYTFTRIFTRITHNIGDLSKNFFKNNKWPSCYAIFYFFFFENNKLARWSITKPKLQAILK